MKISHIYVGFVFLFSAVALMASERPPEVDLRVLEEMPIQHGGRKKPLYAFAQDQLRAISGKGRWEDEKTGARWGAMQVAVDVWLHPEAWTSRPVILMDYIPLKKTVGVGAESVNRTQFSYDELTANLALREIIAEAARIKQRNPQAVLTREQQAAAQVGGRIQLMHVMLNGQAYRWLPHPTELGGVWATMETGLDYYPPETMQRLGRELRAMVAAYDAGDPQAWQDAVMAFEAEVAVLAPELYPKHGPIHLEWMYKKWRPVTWAWILYVLAFIIILAAAGRFRTVGYRAAWVLAGTGVLLQAAGLGLRVAISGRPPVTNMYETVIWVAFIAVFTSLVFEAITRGRYFLIGAMPVAILSLILADTQPTILDGSIQPLVPVLRDNFWLVVHVLTIVSSYAPLALALGVAHIALGKVIFNQPVDAKLYQYIYRCLQVGVFLLGTGTILGGVWANYSWGRFWGWDPKETWALIAFMSYLAILHGRIAGWWGGFGMAVGSFIAFQTVIMAWYGVNFVLGKGLHSYGFGTGGFPAVLTFVLLEMGLVAIAVWRHSQPKTRRITEPSVAG
jgi:ABC-type transport system involved in cytochrome c biogenesis permease subunit